ncbi:DsbA family protein [Falsihalocynthiibacter arcticus]|uniref:Thiol-disulfide oxidoreductase n=1 Tax=Falsihalocynthiibacter arcticus TaxID=1579316 RepID=A0A126UYU7_9RHOB|nr:DsbA family protein [Falsihalocynthiibacter arcticus]AML50816.1 thiol-disulfide oxidoreductase [Falsihalocynthiibacter arcticus]
MNRREFTSALALSIIPAMGGSFAFAQDAENAPMTGITEMVLGSPEAPIEIIEYASYTCPHCANFHTGTFQKIKENYIDTGKVRFVYREVYFDRYGLWASMVARCGGEERFFAITETLYNNQKTWATGEPTEIAENLRKIGLVDGLDKDALDACLADGEQAEALVAWFQENATRDEITGTPSFMINGTKFENATYQEFADHLDGLL